jgi:DNA polymerase delta subunit 2
MLCTLGRTVPLEVMPGAGDPTNCFLPQQPIHPIMLLNASRQAQAMRLATNPFSFEIESENKNGVAVPKTSFLVTSGQNVADVMRQSKLDVVQTLTMQLRWGHLCPTAPNTLPCFPFQSEDPFVLTVAPHCVVTCGATASGGFETSFKDGTRFVSVPRFAATGQIVLVDVASPTLAPRVVTLSVEAE